MSKFQVGDSVRIKDGVGDLCCGLNNGDVGTVREVTPADIAIDFKTKAESHWFWDDELEAVNA